MNTLRYRKAAFAGAFVALFCAAAMVCACGMLLDTGLRGTVKPERYAGAPIVVAGDPETRFQKRKVKGDEVKTKVKSKPNTARAWIPAELAERLRGVPGVRSVVTEVSFPVPGTGAEGHGWESAALTPFTLRAGRAPVADGEIVVDAGGPGVGARVGSYRVVGVTRERLEHQRVVFLSTGEARRLAVRAGKVNAVGVWPAGAEGAVREAVRGSGAVVQVGDGRGRVEFLGADGARARLVSMGAALGGTSLIVALLSVVGTFGLAMQQRERELALLRAVAMTPRQLRKMIGSEALVLGLAAAVPGALAGMLLGGWLHGAFTALGAIPANLPLSVGVFPPVVAVAATVPAAWLAARVAARRVARLRPVEA
ncbi:ABC transporter permease, partial [Actinomadura kijaniata]|uniref:ABC transporter permease n=1 Tax=Actinomadura kijaniata TaxID=46161 RepID=UPI001FDFE939